MPRRKSSYHLMFEFEGNVPVMFERRESGCLVRIHGLPVGIGGQPHAAYYDAVERLRGMADEIERYAKGQEP